MSEEKFLMQNRNIAEVSSTPTSAVYKKIDHGLGHLPSAKFYYFQNGKLVKIEETERQPDITFQPIQ